MAYTRVPPFSGTGAITHLPSAVSPIPVSDPVLTDYHPIPGSGNPIINQPPASASVPTMVALDITQSSGSYIVGDDVLFTVTVPDATDGVTTTGVNLYETGVLVGAAVRTLAGTWVYTVTGSTAGSKSYVARRVYSGGTIDSTATTFTVLASMAPTDITDGTLTAWWKTPESFQWGTTPLHTAGTGGAMTLAGTLTGLDLGLQFRINPTGGAVGVATYEVSINNGTAYTYQAGTTAASGIALTGTSATFGFGAGTYVTSDVYKAALVNLNDQTGNAHTLTNGTSGQRPFPQAGLVNNYTSARFDGVNDVYNCTTTLANTLCGGTNTPYTVFAFVNIISLPGAGVATIFRFGSNATNQCGGELRIKAGTTALWEVLRRDSAGNTVTLTSNIPATLSTHILCMRFDGTSVIVSDNGADVIGGSSDVSGAFSTAASITLNNLSVGAQNSAGTVTSWCNMDLYDMPCFNAYVGNVQFWRHMRYY